MKTPTVHDICVVLSVMLVSLAHAIAIVFTTINGNMLFLAGTTVSFLILCHFLYLFKVRDWFYGLANFIFFGCLVMVGIYLLADKTYKPVFDQLFSKYAIVTYDYKSPFTGRLVEGRHCVARLPIPLTRDIENRYSISDDGFAIREIVRRSFSWKSEAYFSGYGSRGITPCWPAEISPNYGGRDHVFADLWNQIRGLFEDVAYFMVLITPVPLMITGVIAWRQRRKEDFVAWAHEFGTGAKVMSFTYIGLLILAFATS